MGGPPERAGLQRPLSPLSTGSLFSRSQGAAAGRILVYQVYNQINSFSAQQPRLNKPQQRAFNFQGKFCATDNVKEILVTPRGCEVTTLLLACSFRTEEKSGLLLRNNIQIPTEMAAAACLHPGEVGKFSGHVREEQTTQQPER